MFISFNHTVTKAFIDSNGSWLMQDLCKAAERYPQADLVSAITAVSENIISILCGVVYECVFILL